MRLLLLLVALAAFGCSSRWDWTPCESNGRVKEFDRAWLDDGVPAADWFNPPFGDYECKAARSVGSLWGATCNWWWTWEGPATIECADYDDGCTRHRACVGTGRARSTCGISRRKEE